MPIDTMKCPGCQSDKLEIHCETTGCNWAKCNCGVVFNKQHWTKRGNDGKYQETRKLP